MADPIHKCVFIIRKAIRAVKNRNVISVRIYTSLFMLKTNLRSITLRERLSNRGLYSIRGALQATF